MNQCELSRIRAEQSSPGDLEGFKDLTFPAGIKAGLLEVHDM